MKKTGKALSLVLSLALVVSSLTTAFASAATEGSTVALKNDTAYFSNGTTATTDVAPFFESSNVKSFKSSSGYDVTDYKIKGIALTSGTSLATLGTLVTDGNGVVTSAPVTLNNASSTGTIGLAARYEGSYTKTDGTTVSVSGVSNLKISILKANTVVFGGAAAAADIKEINDGTKPAALGTLAKNCDTANTIYGGVYVLSQKDGSAIADWKPAKLAKNISTAANVKSYLVESNVANAKVTVAADGDPDFSLSIDGADAYKVVPPTSVTLTATMVKTASVADPAADAKLYDKTTAAADSVADTWQQATTTKIENRIKTSIATPTISTKSGHTYIATTQPLAEGGAAATSIQIDGLDVDAGSGDVTFIKGTVGKLSTTGIVTVTTGSITAISGAANVTINNGNIGAISDEQDTATVNVNGGKVTSIAPADGKNITVNVLGATKTTPANVGTITAGTVKVGGDSTTALAASAVGKITAPVITVDGAKASVSTIDANKAVTAVTYTDDYVGNAVPIINVISDKLPAVQVDSGAEVNFPSSVSLGSVVDNGKVTFNDQTSVAGISGAGTGTVVFAAGKLYTTDAISSVTMEVLGGKITSGMTLFTAPLYTVSEASFTPKGYTVARVSGDKIDTFKVDKANFYGIVLNKTTDKLAINTTATYTASAYPSGIALPDGATIKMTFSGSDDYFDFKDNGNGTATLKAKKMDNIFADLNKGTITATLYDQYGIELSQYAPATCNVTIVEKPVVNFTCDSFPTTMKAGQQYTVKITSTDGTAPKTTFADGFAVVTKTTTSGNSTFVSFTAKTAGDHGVYVGGNRVAVINVKGSICDTATVTKKAGQPYTFKVTSLTKAAPSFVVAGIGSIKPSKVDGNAYYYTVKATANKGVHGVYVNGAAIALYTFA